MISDCEAPPNWEDPIVAEVRKAREQIFAAYEYDMEAYWAHLGEVEKAKRAQGFQYVDKPLPKRNLSACDQSKPEAA